MNYYDLRKSMIYQAQLLAALLLAAQPNQQLGTGEPVPTDGDHRGTIGICLKWDQSNPNKVSDAVVVDGSGDRLLDDEAPAAIKALSWPRPDDYKGQWIGITLKIGGSNISKPIPSCDSVVNHY